MTPDGYLLVDIHALTYTYRGNNHRGKQIRDRLTAYFVLSYEDNESERESAAELFPEHLQMLTDAGYNINWSKNGERVEFAPPIPVTLDENRKLVEVRGKGNGQTGKVIPPKKHVYDMTPEELKVMRNA